MQVLSWGTPVGWAIFVVAVGVTAYLLSMAVKILATVPPMPSTTVTKKK